MSERHRWRAPLIAMVAVAAMGAVLFLGAGPSDDRGGETLEFAIAGENELTFNVELPVRVHVVLQNGGQLDGDKWECRWNLAHDDVGLNAISPNGCVAQVYVDPDRTRLSRFEHDEKMAIDVVIRRDGQQVGFATGNLRFERD